MIIKSNFSLIIPLFIFLGGVCHGKDIDLVPRDAVVASLLSDGAVFGKITVSSWLGEVAGLVDGKLDINGESPEELFFYNALATEINACDSNYCVAFFHDGRHGRRLVQYPVVALFSNEFILYKYKELKADAINMATSSLQVDHCSADMVSLLEGLDGKGQQSSINSLFSRRFSKDDLLCLASQIGSSSRILMDFFSPPYKSAEKVYYHGLRTRGELIALLLPHITKINIINDDPPFSDRVRQQFVEAWTYIFLTQKSDETS